MKDSSIPKICSSRNLAASAYLSSEKIEIKIRMKLLERFNDPLSMLPGVIILCVLRQNDFRQTKLTSGVVEPVDESATMLPAMTNKFCILIIFLAKPVSIRNKDLCGMLL